MLHALSLCVHMHSANAHHSVHCTLTVYKTRIWGKETFLFLVCGSVQCLVWKERVFECSCVIDEGLCSVGLCDLSGRQADRLGYIFALSVIQCPLHGSVKCLLGGEMEQ